MNKSPCKDCTKRKLKCHSSCEDYKEFRKNCDKKSDEKLKKHDMLCLNLDNKRFRTTQF